MKERQEALHCDVCRIPSGGVTAAPKNVKEEKRGLEFLESARHRRDSVTESDGRNGLFRPPDTERWSDRRHILSGNDEKRGRKKEEEITEQEGDNMTHRGERERQHDRDPVGMTG